MKQSRDIILERLSNIPKYESSKKRTLPEWELQISWKPDTITPKKISSLIDQFKKELENVSGEYRAVKNEKEAASFIERFMIENRSNRIAITGETVCQRISREIIQKKKDWQWIQPCDLDVSDRKRELSDTPISLVQATYAIADIGALVFSYHETKTFLPHFLSECIISVLSPERLFPTQFDLIRSIEPEKIKNMTMVTGPSRTADIEKILFLGAHGPKRLIVLMLPSSRN